MGQRPASVVLRLFVAAILVAGGIFFNAPEARGHGFGLHAAGGFGEGFHRQAGLSWDTSVAGAHLFSYRMNLGYETFELDDDWGESESFDGWILENTFGFRLFASEGVRLWGGPQLVFGIYDSEIGPGIGLALGANLHVSESTSIGITIGGRQVEYTNFLGGSDHENIGFLRLDFFYRAAKDRFRRR